MDEKASTVSRLNRLARDFRVAWGVAGFFALLVIISGGLVAWMWSNAVQPASSVQRTLPQKTPAQASACAPAALAQAPTAPAALAVTPADTPTAAAAPTESGAQPSLSADFAARLNQLASTGQPFQLDLFVMSKCPYGNIAEAVVLPWLEAHPGAIDFHLWFIASGDASSGFQSLHGPTELAEDLRQEAILSHYPAKLNDYLSCRNANYSDDNGWIACAVNLGLKPDVITRLAQSAATAAALRTSLTRADSLGVQASPTLYLNGSIYNGAIFDIQQ
jgi:hypothetical protein